ncbi:MAG: condensation domain-containing protein, partial [Pseudonocardiaceae bacterium]
MSDLLLRLAALRPDDRTALMSRLRPPPHRAVDGEAGGPVHASLAQTRLWFLQQLDPKSPVHNLVAGLRFEGPLDVSTLERTLGEIVRRHEALRTSFPAVEGVPVQVVVPPAPVELPLIDLQQIPSDEREQRLRDLCVEQGRRPFDLRQAPLVRFELVHVQPEDHLLILTVHHLAADGWSFGVFTREFLFLYQAFSEGLSSPLAEPAVQHRDVTLWQQQWLQGEAMKAQLAYWKDLLKGDLPILSLPTDHPRPYAQTFNGRLHAFALPQDLSAALKEQGARAGHTLFTRLLSNFAVLLHRLSEQEDLIVGTPVAGRSRLETEGLIGFFVNTLPLRLDLSGAPSHAEVTRRTHQLVRQSLAHQDLPFDRLVQALQPSRDPSRPVLRQVAFVFQTFLPPVVRLADLTVRTLSPTEIDLGLARLDLTLYMWEDEGRLRGSFEYNTDLFDASTVARWADAFRDVVRQALETPDRPIQEGVQGLSILAEHANLTESQILFWFGKNYQPEVRLYFEHITTLFTVRADLDIVHLQRSFQKLVDCSDSLRSVFHETDGIPKRVVRDRIPFELEEVDLSAAPDRMAALRHWAAERSRAELDLQHRPFDSALLKLGPEHCVWYLNVHHLVSDAWSTALLMRDVSEYYRLSREGRLDQAPPLPAFQDYVTYERKLRASERYRRAERYWRDKLAQAPNRISFYGRDGRQPTTRTARVSVDLGPERTWGIQELARREGFMSPAVVLGAALFAYLYRISGERLLRVGTPFANRPTAFRDTIGLFMNACPLQVRLEGDEDFCALARRVQLELVESARHQDYPVRNPAHERVYDVYFNFQNASFAGFGVPVGVELVGSEHSNDRLALQVHNFDASDRFVVDFDFNVLSFGEADRKRSTAHYLNLLDAMLEDPGQRISQARMLCA